MSKLTEILEQEGVRQVELARRSGLSVTTVRRAQAGRWPAPVTRSKLVRALNALADGHYTVEDVFPPKG